MNIENMSTSRVAGADDMAVDEAGGVAPSPEWMEAAQKALENDGILETASAKRQKVRICICTILSQHTSTPELLGESLSKEVPVRVSRVCTACPRAARPTAPARRASARTIARRARWGRSPSSTSARAPCRTSASPPFWTGTWVPAFARRSVGARDTDRGSEKAVV